MRCRERERKREREREREKEMIVKSNQIELNQCIINSPLVRERDSEKE